MPAAKQEKYFTTMATNEELLQVVDSNETLSSADSDVLWMTLLSHGAIS